MKKAPKIQRIDSNPLSSPTSPSALDLAAEFGDDGPKKHKSSILLDAADHLTSTPWPNTKVKHTYDVMNGEFTLSASEGDGSGHFSVKVKTKELYKRIGINHSIPDPKATIRTMRLLQSSALSPGAGHPRSSTGTSECEPSESSEARDEPTSCELKTLVTSELQNVVKYGSSSFVTVKHPQSKETTDYNAVVSMRGTMMSVTFKSVEADKTTGVRSISCEDVASLVADLIGVGADELNFAEAFKTTGGKKSTLKEFMASADVEIKRIDLLALLPPDSFTGDCKVYCEIAHIYVT